jgi:hypothetical protein
MALSKITDNSLNITDLTIADDLTVTDDLLLASDGAIIKFGADADVTLTHVHDTGLTLNTALTATALTASGDVSLDGGNFVFNESGAAKDFRIEGDTFSNLFICDGSEDDIGMGLTPSFTSGNGLHLADDFKIGFGAGGNSRPDFQLGYSTSSSTLELACGFGADDADIKFTASGGMELNGDLNTNIQVTNSKDGSGTGLIRVDADATSYTGSTRAFVADYSGTAHSSAQIGFQLEGSAGVKGLIVSTGNTTCSFTASSDERLKTDITDLTDGLTTINKLRPRKFKWISEGKDAEHDHGFVAQELYEDYKSRAVVVGGDDPKTDPWSVDGSKLVPMLVKALQEADAKIEALTLRVTALEKA